MFRRIFSFVGILVVLFCTTGTVRGGIIRTDVPDSSYVTAGQNPMFQSVGCLFIHDGDNWDGGCGELIDPSWVLTVGHAAYGLNGSVSQLLFRLGPDAYKNYTDSVYADAWYIHPGFIPGAVGSGVDLALVHLSHPITDVTPATLFQGTDQRNTLFQVGWYGSSNPAGSGPAQQYDGIKRGGSNIAEWFGDDPPYAKAQNQYDIATFNLPYEANCQPLEWQLSPGDSGCGWFQNVNGTYELGAIGTDYWPLGNYDYGSLSGAIRVSPYTGWINSYVVPEPGTLAMLAGAIVLLPLYWLRRFK